MAVLTTGTVTGRFEGNSSEAVTGTVTFTPEASSLLSAETTPKAVILPTPKTVELVDGAFSVSLTGTDNATLNPVDWTYRVRFDLRVNGAAVNRSPVSIKVVSGVSSDLADISPVPSSVGNAVVRGPRGEQGPAFFDEQGFAVRTPLKPPVTVANLLARYPGSDGLLFSFESTQTQGSYMDSTAGRPRGSVVFVGIGYPEPARLEDHWVQLTASEFWTQYDAILG